MVKRYSIAFQIILIVALTLLILYFSNNAISNITQQGIASGFDFLNHSSGFNIIMHLIDYSESSTYFRAFIVGLLNTLLLSILGIIFATFIGFIIGIARLSQNFLVSKLATAYIEIFRNVPLLLQIFFWYFAILRSLPSPRSSFVYFDSIFFNIRGLYIPRPVPQTGFYLLLIAILCACGFSFVWRKICVLRLDITGKQIPMLWPILGSFIFFPLLIVPYVGFPITWEYPKLQGFNFTGGITIIPELTAMLIALSVYTASFIAEIVRAGILSVNKGQTEAAYALGLTPGITMRLIIIPQALRVIIPPLTSQYLNLTKNSSLAAAIAYPELVSVFAGTVLNQTGQAVEVIFITMSVYLTISLFISALMNWYNHKMALL